MLRVAPVELEREAAGVVEGSVAAEVAAMVEAELLEEVIAWDR